MLSINFLKFKDCPTAPKALGILRSVLEKESVKADIKVIDIENEEDAIHYRFLGSPTIQINGYDIEMQRRGDKPGYGCRIYQTVNGPSGVPDESLILEAVQRAIKPKLRILFLCTGNSCRSQMVEGWARHLKGNIADVFSAGIIAKGIDPLAVKVMAEEGIDISNQKSKSIDELESMNYDYVITLCSDAEENCPYFPGNVKRLHFGFDDPPKLAEQEVSEEEKLKHYRRVRDEIKSFVEKIPDILYQ